MNPDNYEDLTPSETINFLYHNTDDELISVSKKFETGICLGCLAIQFQRFLIAAGFDDVSDVIIETCGENTFAAH